MGVAQCEPLNHSIRFRKIPKELVVPPRRPIIITRYPPILAYLFLVPMHFKGTGSGGTSCFARYTYRPNKFDYVSELCNCVLLEVMEVNNEV